MKWTTARATTLMKELDELDDGIKYEQMIYGSLKNDAMEKDDKSSEQNYQKRLDEYMAVRSAIDTVIEFLDGCEVRL
jgi:hypothetical protein